jgi:hypothetical protein
MEKFEIMKSIFAVTQSMPTKSTNRTRLLNLIDKLYETDRIDVVFKKEAYSPHNLKHKHLTNKEGFSQLIKSETIMRAQVC